MPAELRRKMIAVPFEKGMTEQPDGTLLVRGFFTSDQRDMVGDIITREATEKALPAYRQWGNIRRMHLPEPVGRVTRIGTEDGLAWNEVEIKVINPQAVFEVKNGLLQALSIGALVDLDEVTILPDGGWVINGYTLAEISLVDHPANYDALLQLSLTDAVRDLAREQGVDAVLKSLGAQTGELMPKKKTDVLEKELPVDEVVVPAEEVPAAVEEPVMEEKALEADPVVEPAAVEEKVLDEGDTVEEAVEPAVAEATSEEVSPLDALCKAVEALAAKVDSLLAAQEALSKALEPRQVERVVEPALITELQEKNAALQARIDELTLPVERKAVLPVEDSTPESSDHQESPAAEEPVADLRAAVRRFVTSRHK